MTFDAIGIAGSALTVHRKWLDAVSDNLANMNNASRTDGQAFRARYVEAAGAPTVTACTSKAHRWEMAKAGLSTNRTTPWPMPTVTSGTRTSTWRSKWAR